MMKYAMSAAAAGLLRALLNRAGVDRDRVLLIEFTSATWNSLTFDGARHRILLRIPGPGSAPITARLTNGIDEADLPIPGHIVADIALVGPPVSEPDGSALVTIEALTVAS